jgi:hypothetical protein
MPREVGLSWYGAAEAPSPSCNSIGKSRDAFDHAEVVHTCRVSAE